MEWFILDIVFSKAVLRPGVGFGADAFRGFYGLGAEAAIAGFWRGGAVPGGSAALARALERCASVGGRARAMRGCPTAVGAPFLYGVRRSSFLTARV